MNCISSISEKEETAECLTVLQKKENKNRPKIGGRECSESPSPRIYPSLRPAKNHSNRSIFVFVFR